MSSTDTDLSTPQTEPGGAGDGPDAAGAGGGGMWDRIARTVTTHPVWVMALALLIVVPPLLAVPSMRLTHDILQELPNDTQAVQGFQALGRHFPKGEIAPLVLVIDDDESVMQPASFRALGDLSRNLKRLGIVASVRSVAMPTNGEQPDVQASGGVEQITRFGDRLQEAADGAGRIRDGLVQLQDGLQRIDARLPELSNGLDDATDGVAQLLDGVAQLRDGTGRLQDGLGELHDGLVDARDGAKRLHDEVAVPAEQHVKAAWDTLFDQFTVGKADPAYRDALTEVGQVYGRITGDDPRTGEQVDPSYDGLPQAMSQLHQGLGDAVDGTTRLSDGVGQLDGGLARVQDGLAQLEQGLADAKPGVATLQDAIDQMLAGVNRLVDGAGQLRSGLAQGAAQIKDTNIASLLPGVGQDSGPFVITPGMLQAMPEIRDRLGFFLAKNDHRTRVFIGLSTSPFAPDALQSVDQIDEIARISLASSPLEDAQVLPTGLSAFFNNLDKAADRDFTMIIVAVILGVFLVLALLLRALVAPLYMVATVLLSFAASLGIATVVFQGFLHQLGLAWWVPPFLYVLLVALGADYNIFLMSRVREEAETKPTRVAVAEATRLTGGVITSAGLILAGTFAAMMAASMTSLVQMGFATTVGILLDTFVVRTFLVPAIATLLGRHNWWPSKRSHAEAEAGA